MLFRVILPTNDARDKEKQLNDEVTTALVPLETLFHWRGRNSNEAHHWLKSKDAHVRLLRFLRP